MFYIRLLITMLLFFPLIKAQKAIVIVPVAELVGQPMKAFYPYSNPETLYQAIPFCGRGDNATTGITCARIHQALLHEQIDILQEKDDEVCIRIPSAVYMSHGNPKEFQEFWTLKKYVVPYDTLKKHGVSMQNFPEPIALTNDHIPQNHKTITLIQPFFDPITKQHLSAGTRLVLSHGKKLSQSILAYIFDPLRYHFIKTRIPKKICILNTPRDKKECIDLFIRILKSWAHQPEPYAIPYVFGGCSSIHTYPEYRFSQTPAVAHNNTTKNAYGYNTTPSVVASGFDCSGIILRAAQMAGIPYCCKNTSAIAAKLKPLSNSNQLHDGDLLLIPGHVMIMADAKKNTMIEARGYDHGYGKVHEIPLKEQFKDIQTYQNLVDAYRQKKPLVRLNKSGDVVQTIKNYTLFTLASAWDA